MPLKRTRLDRLLSGFAGINRRDVKLMLAHQRVEVDGRVATDACQQVDGFSRVMLDGQVLQDNTPHYLMLNKPVGVVSATKDELHKTVIDLLDRDYFPSLHIAGRLDLNSSGLLLLTNDGRWSRRLSSPEMAVTKLYRVTLEKPLTEAYISAFAEGMYFAYEGITTRPAKLKIVSKYVAEVSLVEGRYHQIKRMFGRFRNPVLALHRIAIGRLELDSVLAAGCSRELTKWEVQSFWV